MNTIPNIFVSYTVRDGEVDDSVLESTRDYLSRFSHPFVDRLAGTSRFPQLRVFWKLMRCDLLLLIESPQVYSSPWVKLELMLAKLTLKPTVKMAAMKDVRNSAVRPLSSA